MAIINRSLDPSQKEVLPFFTNVALTNGETGVLSYVPYPCMIKACNLAAFSIESTPNLLLNVTRFIPGSGVTTFNLGSTFAPPSYGTSGVLSAGVSLPASGNSLLLLMPNDVIGYVVGGGSTAAIFGFAGCFVVQPVQDIKVFLGLV